MGIGPLNRIDLTALPVDPVAKAETPVAARELVKAVKELNRSQFSSSDRQLTFRWDAASNRPIIRIVNRATGDLIEEIPSEEFLRIMDDLGNTGTKREQ